MGKREGGWGGGPGRGQGRLGIRVQGNGEGREKSARVVGPESLSSLV